MVRGLWIFSTLATLLGAQQISAQEKQAEGVITLQPITVTATPLEAEQQHIAQPLEVLHGAYFFSKRPSPAAGPQRNADFSSNVLKPTHA